MISVIIPTYKEPDALDICLMSAINGQQNDNEIIVVVDGYYDLNKEVLEKWKDYIKVIDLESNFGLATTTNMGVYNASFDKILIVNDDNVFPMEWDIQLLESFRENAVISPNQIEPYPSMFKQFLHKKFGDVKTFEYNGFIVYEKLIRENVVKQNGSTLPIFMTKKDYLKVGGWDPQYPGPWVVDWDFFLKCELSGMKMLRTYNCHFYHFVSVGTKSPEQIQSARAKENECHEYFKYKWGCYAMHNPITNSKMLGDRYE